ncbi:MAG: FecR domain-containing protein [Pirellula sp.]|jgi:hypothetical protein|nr:FecR family protein [Pirellula sp.]
MSEERFHAILTDFLEGELSEAEMMELHALIDSSEAYRDAAVQSYRLHRMLGLLMEQREGTVFSNSVMQRIPQESASFVHAVLKGIHHDPNEKGIMLLDGRNAPLDRPNSQSSTVPLTQNHNPATPNYWSVGLWLTRLCFASALVMSVIFAISRFGFQERVPSEDKQQDAMFTSMAHSRFLGEYSPPIGSSVKRMKEYVLRSGSVELSFSNGAEVIIVGPSVFRVASADSLILTSGSCSVHAPEGAEGFFVDTPSIRVVDRGTRFALSVEDASGAEVHVVEGAADVYPIDSMHTGDVTAESHALPGISNVTTARLEKSEARLFKDGFLVPPESTTFRSSLYRSHVPDRIVSYVANQSVNGGAEELVSVQIQRNGKAMNYRVEELIPVQLIWFKADGKLFDNTKTQVRHLASHRPLVDERVSVITDRFLNTGAINPGGAVMPITSDPVMSADTADAVTTPGMAVRFDQPVVNQAGPDVVLFELQHLAGTPDGDSFHVVPLRYAPHLHPVTVRSYDLTLTSSETNRLADFFLTEFDEAVDSLSDFQNGSGHSLKTPQPGRSYGLLAVAIDLSDLGYALHESVDGLFFQDTLDDDQRFDPVFIAGFP